MLLDSIHVTLFKGRDQYFNSNFLSHSEEIITIVALLYGDQSILLTPQSKRVEALASRKKFVSSEGDLITYLNIFRAYKQAKNQVSDNLAWGNYQPK